MKITNEQLQALLQQEEARKKQQNAVAPGFDALLSGKLQKSDSTQAVLPPPGAGAIPPLLATQQVQGAESTVPLAEAADRLDHMLDSWERYSRLLGNRTGVDLRAAYSTLEGIDQDVSSLREAMPDLAERHPGMGRMADELEVMTATERVKLNRGDYMA